MTALLESIAVSLFYFCIYRMAGLDKQENRHCLFKDEKELYVALKYMIENGK